MAVKSCQDNIKYLSSNTMSSFCSSRGLIKTPKIEQLRQSPDVINIVIFQSYWFSKKVASGEKTSTPTPEPHSAIPTARALLVSK